MPIYFILALAFLNGTSEQAARVMLSLYALELGAQPLTIGMLAATFSMFPLLVAVRAGKLADRFGVRWLLMFGACAAGMSMLLPYLGLAHDRQPSHKNSSSGHIWLYRVGIWIASHILAQCADAGNRGYDQPLPKADVSGSLLTHTLASAGGICGLAQFRVETVCVIMAVPDNRTALELNTE